MKIVCQDTAFGTMTYNHEWEKNDTIMLFGKEWPVTIAAAAYQGESITQEERKSYQNFDKTKTDRMSVVEQKMNIYVSEHLAELKELNPNVKADNLAELVTPRTLLFQQDGTAVLLLDCTWDEEGGIAVELFPDVMVGAQELFL